MLDGKLNRKLKPVTAVVGTAFVASLGAAGIANADDNPFGAQELDKGYDLLAAHHGEGKCGEGKCGEDKESEGKCGEGKCGEDKDSEGKCGEGKCGEDKGSEGKCGEGKCGGAS